MLTDEEIAARVLELGSFNIKAAKLNDAKSQKLYSQLKGNSEESKKKGGKKAAGKQPVPIAATKSQADADAAAKQSQIFKQLDSSLSTRLQDENPFDEFREAVERAIIEKSKKKSKVFGPDKAFFKEYEDNGMCLSMHQPWASLMVHGFKRFEGREWTSKYRGPLWIHATSQKPTLEQIAALEQAYSEHYAQIGEDLPPFPQRYPTSAVIGRLDLVDVLTLEQYNDTLPEVLREKTTAAYQFVIRNPMYLDMPLRMAGQPSIYKMPKEITIGARPLLKPVQYTWWPPRQFQDVVIG